MKKIFLTGGSGFVGQHLIPILIEKGYEIHALARSENAKAKVQALGATPVLDNLQSLSQNTEKALQNCDYVVHSAAHMDFTYDRKPYYEVNVDSTQRLLRLSQEQGISKFVYISAAPVVANTEVKNLSESQIEPGLPKSLYPRTKAIADAKVQQANTDSFQTIVLRPPAIWGPDNHHYDQVFDRVKSGKWRWIGGGNHTLSTIHVFNLANAVDAALNSEIGGKAYFVTDGDQRSIRETFTSILKAYDLDPGDKSIPRAAALIMSHILGGTWKALGLKSRPPVAPLMIRLMGTEFSISDQKARHELGYKNAISFEEGIRNLNLKS